MAYYNGSNINSSNQLYTINGQTYQPAHQDNSNKNMSMPWGDDGSVWYQGRVYKPYAGLLGQNQPQAPLPTGSPTNPYTQKQLAALGDQRSYGRNFDPYQQYVNKMQNVYGVGPVGAAGDVLQSTINGAGKLGPTGGSNG